MGFALADTFVVRSTGVPFEVLESMATTSHSEVARSILAQRDRLQSHARVAADAIHEHELVEMLPAPHQLVWSEADGHRCFELRTQLVPR